jgi:hypothetical protein
MVACTAAEVGAGYNCDAAGADGDDGIGTCALTLRMNTAIASAMATDRSLRK